MPSTMPPVLVPLPELSRPSRTTISNCFALGPQTILDSGQTSIPIPSPFFARLLRLILLGKISRCSFESIFLPLYRPSLDQCVSVRCSFTVVSLLLSRDDQFRVFFAFRICHYPQAEVPLRLILCHSALSLFSVHVYSNSHRDVSCKTLEEETLDRPSQASPSQAMPDHAKQCKAKGSQSKSGRSQASNA